jgi:hypothetical protein
MTTLDDLGAQHGFPRRRGETDSQYEWRLKMHIEDAWGPGTYNPQAVLAINGREQPEGLATITFGDFDANGAPELTIHRSDGSEETMSGKPTGEAGVFHYESAKAPKPKRFPLPSWLTRAFAPCSWCQQGCNDAKSGRLCKDCQPKVLAHLESRESLVEQWSTAAYKAAEDLNEAHTQGISARRDLRDATALLDQASKLLGGRSEQRALAKRIRHWLDSSGAEE